MKRGSLQRSDRRGGSYGSQRRKRRKRAGFLYIFLTLLLLVVLWPIGMFMLWRRRLHWRFSTKLLTTIITLFLCVVLYGLALTIQTDNPDITRVQDNVTDFLDHGAEHISDGYETVLRVGGQAWDSAVDLGDAASRAGMMYLAEGLDKSVEMTEGLRVKVQELRDRASGGEPAATEAPAETPVPDATETPEAIATDTPEPAPTDTPEPTATAEPEPTATPEPDTPAAPKPASEAVVYCYEASVAYHYESDCGDMKGAPATTLGEAVAAGKHACGICGTPKAEVVEEEGLVWTDEGGLFHMTDECEKFEGKWNFMTVGDALAAGYKSCVECGTDVYLRTLVDEPEETQAPEDATEAPTEDATEAPEDAVTEAPTDEVTGAPTDAVTEAPTDKVTEAPTDAVTEAPMDKVTEAPTDKVTEAPTDAVTEAPTDKVTEAPTDAVTEAPTDKVTEAPTDAVTEAPTDAVTEAPTEAVTEEPTEAPTAEPTEAPTPEPTEAPTAVPTVILQPKPAGEATVYYTNGGKGYHVSPSSHKETSKAKAHTLAEAAAEGKKACSGCKPADLSMLEAEHVVWIDEDHRIHLTDECEDFKGRYTLMTLEDALEKGYKACGECAADRYIEQVESGAAQPAPTAEADAAPEGAGETVELQAALPALKWAGNALVWHTSTGGWYHVVEDCSGMHGAKQYTLADSVEDYKNCRTCKAPLPEYLDKPCLWVDEDGIAHVSDECASFRGAWTLVPVEEAQASKDYTGCPDCGGDDWMAMR